MFPPVFPPQDTAYPSSTPDQGVLWAAVSCLEMERPCLEQPNLALEAPLAWPGLAWPSVFLPLSTLAF